MISVIYQHPVACAVALIVAFYGVAIGSYFLPSTRGETNDRRQA